MLHQEYIKQKLKDLNTCSPVDVSKHSLAILELFSFLGRSEWKEVAESFYKMAEQHAALKPVLFSYAKLVMAFHFFYSEDYESALPMLTETQKLFAELNDADGVAVCRVIEGSIFRTFGNVDLALKALWTGHEQLKKSPLFEHFTIACSISIAGIYYESKQYEEAIPLFKNTLALAEKAKKFYWVIYSLHGLGKVFVMQKKYPEAKECLERAMEVAENNSHPLSVCNSLSELGNYYLAIGDYPQAEEFHTRALAIREQNHFIGGAITSCIRLGEIFIKDSKPDDAIPVLEKGLRLAEEIKVKLKQYQVHSLLSEIFEHKNDSEKSLFHYKRFHELRDQVELEDSARKMKTAQLIFAAEQTQKENVIIKKQKEEIERKNIELQETIDKLTEAKIGKKAKALTLVIAVVLFVLDDFILNFALTSLPANNYLISLLVKMVIIFSLGPINKAIEKYLLKKVIKKKREVIT